MGHTRPHHSTPYQTAHSPGQAGHRTDQHHIARIEQHSRAQRPQPLQAYTAQSRYIKMVIVLAEVGLVCPKGHLKTNSGDPIRQMHITLCHLLDGLVPQMAQSKSRGGSYIPMNGGA